MNTLCSTTEHLADFLQLVEIDMTPEDLIRSLTPDVYENLKKAVELGRWPDGRILTKEQKALSLEAVIQYEVINDIPADQRVGYIEDGCKSDKGSDEQVLTLQ